MAKVIRYFHIRRPGAVKGGATVKVIGDTDFPGQVDVQFVKCSRKDNYDKKIGRSYAEKAPVKVVPLRYLPNELARISQKCGVFNTDFPADYNYSIGYFLPKE
jgi:hypothetical protein